KILHRLLQD
nr:Chain C, NUCLEAR RECEPTOR COACTIVATOR 2 [Homo sapiens]1GWQ_D Chain D, NUCLEAR RECEPTOR COACTIVATOR 2 [Homo sapiens]4PP6_C Chain C, Nuclear receptor coactivator 2 [Homo sapiens]4PP6_D Chain D, Nuclear receptor coactivator 2 [Homo sapiens]4PPP_C Chain C, Nuclear receptor coactivator 2 [Homo sapiens]4PPP_D Chain D, Nuclear receptor coactivator 2 [Homo sapiens]5MKJ_B Chain B, LYS-ILE-LEU-HIS-ARG-LEU-LEU-GLN-ASP [Homo sapiens]